MIHSFLLIGQSNMAGRGIVSEVEPIENSSIKVLRNGRWRNKFVPVNFDNYTAGICLAETFADSYAKDKNVDVGIIPCAEGGSALEEWKVGSLLYDNAVYQCELASRTSNIAGILWHQGEADCRPDRHTTYKERLIKTLTKFRTDTGLEDVPIMLGGLGDFLKINASEHLHNYPIINKALEEAAKELNRCGFVSAKGLTSNPDNLHFSAAALYEFGYRYYEVFKTLEDKNRAFLEKTDIYSATRLEPDMH